MMRIIMNFGGVSVGDFALGSGLFNGAGLFVVRKGFLMFLLQCFVRFVRGFLTASLVDVIFLMLLQGRGVSQRFAGEQFDRVRGHGRICRRNSDWLIDVRVPVIVVFEIFEDVADVEESIAVKTDVHERGLHAGEDAGDFAFVNAADEGELFFALDVNFD
jgi:hypothetical protein